MGWRLSTFGALALPIYNADHALGTGELLGATTQLAGGGLYRELGSGAAPRGATVYEAAGRLLGVANNTLLAQTMAWEARRGTRDLLWRRLDDGALHWCHAELLAPAWTRGVLFQDELEIALSFRMLSANWYATATLPISDLVADDDDLLMMGVEGGGYPASLTVINAGNRPGTTGVWTISPTVSAITSVTLTNSTTGHSWTWAGTLPVGQLLVVDAGAMRVTASGVDAYSAFTAPSNDWRWMALAPGINFIQLSVTPGSAEIAGSFVYQHTYA